MEATTTLAANLRKRDEYNSISTETRRQLIHKVFTLKMPISLASQQLGLKYSTGKTLVQQFRRSGNIDRVKQ
jgi:type VI protein secretion system component Hcp